jgi:DUF4097 and DUF4098 domain-containing protein YvlB
MKSKRTLLYVLPGILLLLLISSTGCDVQHISGSEYTASANFDIRIAVDGLTAFTLNGINGTIDITGSSTADTIHVWGVRKVESDTQNDADTHLDDLQVEVTNTPPTLRIETDQPNNSNGRNYEVTYHVTLPEGMIIIVNNINGNISVDDMENNVNANLVNGNVIISNIGGNIVVTNVNGQIDCRSALALNGICQLSLVNGNIELEIPTSTSALFTASVVNGSISVDNLTLTNSTITPFTTTGTLGGGQGTITMGVTNGNVAVDGY